MATLNVLVLAVGGNVSQGILKALQHDRRPMRIVGADISPLQMGLYTVDRALISPWAHEAAFLPWLIDTCNKERIDVILSGCEPVLLAIARRQREIENASGAQCLCSPLHVLELGDDKRQTCRWLAAEKLPGPAFADAGDSEAVNALLAARGFPLVAKPRHGGGARGVFVVENLHDLDYARGKSDYLLQEYLGSDDAEYTVGCFRDRDGRLAPSCCMRREIVAGTTSTAVLGAFPDVREAAERIVDRLAPLGPCNVQLRMTDRGPICFEINPRFSGTTPIRSHFGYHEVSAVLDNLLEGKPVNLPLVTEGVVLRYWNELYVAPAAHEALQHSGELPDPKSFPAAIEIYGHRN